ncbi:MAG: hypothetical protein HRU43_00510 [Simkaniaceae bacterium]|nr:hypothetical protein [Simkaniaceae bacterium]
MKSDKILRPDAKGRICLGTLSRGISGYRAIIDEDTMEITLKPYTEMPLSEKWLFNNKAALESVKRGLEQSSQNQTTYHGSFVRYAEEDH